MRPGCLRVDVVGRDGRHAAPVVDAGAQQRREPFRLQIGRRLDVHGRPQHQAGNGNRPHMILERRLGRAGHARARLGAKVLDDHFLDVAVPLMRVADGKQGLDALSTCLADADQDAGGEGHPRAPCRLQRGQPYRGMLVRRAEVRTATLREPLRSGLQHHTLRYRHLAQPCQPGFIQHARIEMRQQARLLQHQRRGGFQIGERESKPSAANPSRAAP